MASLIGHNNPPKDRKVDWKSVSLNKYVYKQLQQLAERRMNINNCFGLLDGKALLHKKIRNSRQWQKCL